MSTGRVVVVGGGPGGASTAWQLARAGVEVTVLDRAHFPRDKPCAEYLTPGASELLDEMGALAAVRRAGAARLSGMDVRAPGGTWIRGRFSDGGDTPNEASAHALRRTQLDAILLEHAAAAGAQVRQGAHMVGLCTDGAGGVTGVRVLDAGRERELRAELVIGADGLRSVVARRLGVARATRTRRRLAIVAHFRGVDALSASGEMHVDAGGYCGIAAVEASGTTSVFSLVVPAESAEDMSGDPAAFLLRWIAARPHLARRYRYAELTDGGRVRTTGPFGRTVRRAWAPGALLVGDAAGYFDPFTGEGIQRALLGSFLLLPHALDALAAHPRSSRGRRALAAYDTARRRAFAGHGTVERLIAAVVARPALLDRAAHVLARRQDMADVLVRVTGDLAPPRAVLRPAYLLPLLLGALASSRYTT